MVNVLKNLTTNVDNMHDQIGDFSRETETVRNNQWEMLELRTKQNKQKLKKQNSNTN